MSQYNFMRFSRGFTLIELLVVISIIGVLAGVLLPNFVGVRDRASDTRLKSDLRQLKNALRLYYNDYQQYPAPASSNTAIDCDPTVAVSACGDAFTISGTVYMKDLPPDFEYYIDSAGTADRFLLKVDLENASDEDIEVSQEKCVGSGHGYTYPNTYGTGSAPEPTEYFVCED